MEIAGLRDVFSVCQTYESPTGPRWLYSGRDEVQKWLWEQDVSFYHYGLKNLVVCYDKCLNKFGNYVKK
jgi:hypothetical protein